MIKNDQNECFPPYPSQLLDKTKVEKMSELK